MRKKQRIFFTAVVFFLVALIPLITGAKILTYPIIKEPYFPLGNLLTAIGYIALPCAFYFGINRLHSPFFKYEKLFSKLFKFLILISTLWIPIGFLLSGNLSNSFGNATTFQSGNTASKLFWYYSYGLSALSFILVAFFLIIHFIFSRKKTKG